MEARLARRGWSLEVSGLAEVAAGEAIPVSVLLSDKDGHGVGGVAVSIELVRPGHKQASPTPLVPVNPGQYQAQLPPVEAGSWVAQLSLGQGDETIVLEKSLTVR
jgi:nitrogen fixation protein FixH